MASWGKGILGRWNSQCKGRRLKSPGQWGQGGWNRVMEETRGKRPEGWVGAGMKAGWCQVVERTKSGCILEAEPTRLSSDPEERGRKKKGLGTYPSCSQACSSLQSAWPRGGLTLMSGEPRPPDATSPILKGDKGLRVLSSLKHKPPPETQPHLGQNSC